MSIGGLTDWVDIVKFTLADDDYGGQSRSSVSVVTSAQLARVSVDKAASEQGTTTLNEYGLHGKQFWKMLILRQTLLYTDGEYYVRLNTNARESVILPNNLYRITRHRRQRNADGARAYDSISMELDEDATAQYRTIQGISPATLPFGQ